MNIKILCKFQYSRHTFYVIIMPYMLSTCLTCALLSCSVVSDTLRSQRGVYSLTAACQGPLSMGILQARLLECIAMPYYRGYSQTRNRTQVSHIASRFFTIWHNYNID